LYGLVFGQAFPKSDFQMTRVFSAILTTSIVIGASSAAEAAKPALIQVEVDRVKHEGRVEARTNSLCWLMNRSGKLTELQLAKIKHVKQLSPTFRPLTSTMLSTSLRRQFGKTLEVRSTRHYLVAAPKGKAKAYAELFEDIYRTFYMHFSVRGFKVSDPEFPLVAIIFPNHAAFAQYAKQDSVDARPGLMGYYMRTTNRVALFEGQSPRKESAKISSGKIDAPDKIRGAGLQPAKNAGKMTGYKPAPRSDRTFGGRVKMVPINEAFDSKNKVPQLADYSLRRAGDSWGAIEGSLRDTMIHEATHQVAFNVGLHTRIGNNPKWIVEGLATVFEAEGIRDSSIGRSAKYRINRDRYIWFQNYAKERHKKGALEKFIRNDSMFKSQTLDAYAFSWALSFFLIETRPRQYSKLLKQLGSRDVLNQLTETERLQMFKKTIGSNMKLLEAEMLRFFNRIK
jgi:hypothetical protein